MLLHTKPTACLQGCGRAVKLLSHAALLDCVTYKEHSMALRPLIAGNWKMNGLCASITEFDALKAGLATLAHSAEILICPPATLIDRFAHSAKGSVIQIGGQDCHSNPSGAHTGDISAVMLKDLGACYVIVGHSERRADHYESSAIVATKALAAIKAGLMPIICIGETLVEREAGKVMEIVLGQLRESIALITAPNYVVAYEPVWAIGTGKIPTLSDIRDVHNALRAELIAHESAPGEKVRILYGGSVKPENARDILAIENVNGALVGGASLKAADFMGIIAAA
jgi:triosephosphate isomerase (TIM)